MFLSKFSKPFNSYLGEDAVHNLTNSMVEESKYFSDIMKKLVMTKEDDEDFENSTECWICDQAYVDDHVKKVRDYCHITGKFKGSVHRNCNINVKLNQNFPNIFHNLNNYDLHLIMQELGKFNFKINAIPNGLEKYISNNINNKLIFIDSFQFLSFPLDDLVESLGKVDFNYLSQELDSNVLDLVEQKGLYPLSLWVISKSLKKGWQAKKSFTVLW